MWDPSDFIGLDLSEVSTFPFEELVEELTLCVKEILAIVASQDIIGL